MAEQPRRRADDKDGGVIAVLVADVALLKQSMERNTAITEEVKEILSSFKLFGKICKWLAAIGGGVYAVFHAPDALRDFINHK